jgi:AraC-like DNA-binding protein
MIMEKKANPQKADGFQNEYLFVLPDKFLAQLETDELFRSLVVTDIGYFPHAAYHFRQRPQGCKTAILIYCSAGSGFYSINGGEIKTISAGQLTVIPPDTPHKYGASETNPWSIFWVHFRGVLFRPWYTIVSQYVPITVSDVFGEKIKELFRQCFTLLKTHWKNEEYFYMCQLMGTILGMTLCAGKESEIQLTTAGSLGLKDTIVFMKKHLHEVIALDDLTRVSGFSPSHLHNLFKNATGYAPIEYFLRIKIEAASQDLYFSDLPVKDIAIAYGIEDPYYFSRLFKKIVGVSPVKYRSQVRG